jgi:hypothetical protein
MVWEVVISLAGWLELVQELVAGVRCDPAVRWDNKLRADHLPEQGSYVREWELPLTPLASVSILVLVLTMGSHSVLTIYFRVLGLTQRPLVR